MARLSRLRAVVGLCVLPVLARASWTPRPLTDYESELPARGSQPGVRRFGHREVHRFDDGTDLELHWEVDADPDSILALDLEHPRGGRIHECRADGLTLHVRHEHAAQAARWQHVTASDSLHGCSHLHGSHLYRRVVRVEEVRNHSHSGSIAVVRLATQELASPSQVFPHCRYYFSFVPVQAKEPEERARSVQERRLMFGNSLTPSSNSRESLLNFNVPRQLSSLGYNWDYNANTTLNPQFKYTFPGGVGFVRLYQPYLKAHFSLNINFTSHISSVHHPPHVTVSAELKGYSDFNLNLATAINFQKEKSAGVLKDVLKMLDLGLGNNTSSDGETFLNPIKFYFGGTPLTVKPGFSCKLKGYHIGLLKGSLRVGLMGNILMRGLMTFDSSVGLLTNFSARANHINFTAPTWMLFTQHFEMGVMLEPMFSLKGGFGHMKDMEVGFAFRPYFNVSIMQENPAQLGGDTSSMAELAVYPFRAVGLPAGRSFSIKVGANGQNKQTAAKFSTGVVEFNDNVEDFEFGSISENALLTVPIEVAILESGQDQPIATGQATCASVVNGICKPSPVTAQMQVDGKTVYVHLSVVWDQNALSILMTKIKSVSLRFPTVSVSGGVAQQLSNPQALSSVELRVIRNGRTYSVPLSKKEGSSSSSSTLLLQSRVIYDLGPCFLESWKSAATLDADKSAQDLLTPKLELLVGGSIVGTGSMPERLSWDKTTTGTSFTSLASNLQGQLKTLPVMVPLYPPGGGTQLVGTGEIEIDVLPAQLSAFWVYPFQQEDFTVGKFYTFYWTLVNGKEGQKVNFTLTAMKVGQDGSLTPTNWQQPVQTSCSINGSVPVKRYDGGVQPCLYSYNMQIPRSLANQQIVVVASWLGGSYMSPHWMVSTPIRFSTGRRLKNKGSWGATSLGAVNHTGFGSKVHEKLDKLRSHCSAQPLKYSIGAGMNFVEHMKNVVMPVGGTMMGLGDKPKWTSKPIPIIKPLGSRKGGGGHLKDILPRMLCTGGICDGMMPGCNRTRVNPIVVRKMNVKLSRLFRWKKHFGPKMRHGIAYALALAPSMIQLGQSQAVAPEGGRRLRRSPERAPAENKAETGAATAAVASAAARSLSDGQSAGWLLPGNLKTDQPYTSEEGRFVVEQTDGEDHEVGDAEFDSFDIHITGPIHYELTEGLLHQFLQRGAFRDLSDGRESTHGPVEVVGFELFADSPPLGLAAREELWEARGAPGPDARLPGWEARRRGWACKVTATSVACMALLVAALVMARAAIRRRGYTLVDPPDVFGDSRLFA